LYYVAKEYIRTRTDTVEEKDEERQKDSFTARPRLRAREYLLKYRQNGSLQGHDHYNPEYTKVYVPLPDKADAKGGVSRSFFGCDAVVDPIKGISATCYWLFRPDYSWDKCDEKVRICLSVLKRNL
jgi:hypothetical protein